MITPDQILTHKNDPEGKERTAKILNDYCDGQTCEQIAANYLLTHQAVSYLIKKNASVIQLDAHYEKLRRVNRLNKIFAETSDKLSSKKDILNVISELRHEIEGEKSQAPNNIGVTVYNINGERSDRFRSKVQASRITAEDPKE